MFCWGSTLRYLRTDTLLKVLCKKVYFEHFVGSEKIPPIKSYTLAGAWVTIPTYSPPRLNLLQKQMKMQHSRMPIKKKNPVFFCKCVLSPVGEKQRTMADAVHFCGTLNTDVITGLDMCKVCTEAVHGVALWTRTLSRAWTRVKYIPKQSFLESKICCFLLFISGNSSFVLNQND